MSVLRLWKFAKIKSHKGTEHNISIICLQWVKRTLWKHKITNHALSSINNIRLLSDFLLCIFHIGTTRILRVTLAMTDKLGKRQIFTFTAPHFCLLQGERLVLCGEYYDSNLSTYYQTGKMLWLYRTSWVIDDRCCILDIAKHLCFGYSMQSQQQNTTVNILLLSYYAVNRAGSYHKAKNWLHFNCQKLNQSHWHYEILLGYVSVVQVCFTNKQICLCIHMLHTYFVGW